MQAPGAHGRPESVFEDVQDDVAPTRQRVFIARQACERCRQRKSRCDGGDPCSLCTTAGAECKYSGRKATKNEVSLGMIFNALQRIETKIEEQGQSNHFDLPHGFQPPRKRSRAVSTSFTATSTFNPISDAVALREEYFRNIHTDGLQASAASPTYTAGSANSIAVPARPLAAHPAPFIQYHIRHIATWPAIRALWAPLGEMIRFHHDSACATRLEQKRPLLGPPTLKHGSLLSRVNVAAMRDLSAAYFTTFNLMYPILDRDVFKQHTLGAAIYSEFGYNVESCLVLVVMALGALGQRSLREGGLPVTSTVLEVDGEDVVGNGMTFFQEARQRAGVLSGDNSMQSCQFHLLSGIFYAQLVRPLEWASMVTRASACCTAFWECPPRDCDEWTLDMQARLFWNTSMFEAMITQELALPVSNLLDYEDRVPLPRFVKFPNSIASVVSPFSDSLDLDSNEQHARDVSLCEYHFLAQIAHRIILTRMRNSMFAPRKTRDEPWDTGAPAVEHALTPASGPGEPGLLGASPRALPERRNEYPPKSLEDELMHQLEQWRGQLPTILQWDDADWKPPQTTPANILVVPWLRARYIIAKYHMSRPLFHRALHHPDTLAHVDIERCRDVISGMMRWTELMKMSLRCQSCLPLKFFICTQVFGLLMLFRALEQSPVPVLRGLLPSEYGGWTDWALSLLKEFSSRSPAIAREHEIMSALFTN